MKSAAVFEGHAFAPPDEELEVEPQDILIETYAVPPAPTDPDPIEVELEAAPPMPASEPRTSIPPPMFAPAWRETPSSLAPVAVSMPEAVPVAPAIAPPALPVRRGSSGVLVTVAALVATAALAGLLVGVAILPGGLARARGVVAERSSQVHHESAAAAAPSRPADPPEATSPSMPSVAVDALPSSAIAVDALPSLSVEPNMTLVTFRKAKKHRVFVDGRAIAVGADPVKIKCGKHKIRSGGMKGRAMILPCGGELTID